MAELNWREYMETEIRVVLKLETGDRERRPRANYLRHTKPWQRGKNGGTEHPRDSS